MLCKLTKLSEQSVIVSSEKKSVELVVAEEEWFGFIKFRNKRDLYFVVKVTVEKFESLPVGSVIDAVILSAHPNYLKLFPRKGKKGPPPSRWRLRRRE